MTPPVGKVAPPNSAQPTDDRTAATDDLRFAATYGPSRAPLGRSVCATERQHGYRPFHGIISRGLRQERIVTVDGWLHAAPLLDAARSDPRPPADPSVEAIVTAADHHGVLTFDESLATARAVARRLAGDRDAWIELWNPKEGHTSSVWRIRVTASDGSIALDVAANVARDRAACAELRSTARHLATAATTAPVAAPLEVLDDDGIVTLIQPWLDGSLEINPVRGPNGSTLAAVESFVTDHEQTRITHVRGRRLSLAEHRAIGFAATRVVQADPSLGFTLRDGDWVLHESAPVLVACDGEPAEIPRDDVVGSVVERFRLTDPAACSALSEGATEALGTTEPRRGGCEDPPEER